jgi:hypothetical protein
MNPATGYFTAAVSVGAFLVVSAGAACSATGGAAFFFAQPLRVTTAAEAQSINAINTTIFFTIFDLLDSTGLL